MKRWSLAIASALAAAPGSVLAADLVVDLLPGHAIHRESAGEAGVVMGLSLTSAQGDGSALASSCEELRTAAGLAPEHGDGLRLEVVFIVPYKAMAVEGHYLSADVTVERGELVPGESVARPVLERIMAGGGMPAHLLDETGVEHEISCETGGQGWHLRWEDVQPLNGEAPAQVIERARQRFMAVHQGVVDHNGTPNLNGKARRSSLRTTGG